LRIDNNCVASAYVISEEGLFSVNFIFLRPSSRQAEVNDAQSFVYGVRLLDAFNGLVIFAENLVGIYRVGDYFFELAYSSEFLFSLVPLDGIPSLILFNFLIGVCLHFIILIKE